MEKWIKIWYKYRVEKRRGRVEKENKKEAEKEAEKEAIKEIKKKQYKNV